MAGVRKTTPTEDIVLKSTTPSEVGVPMAMTADGIRKAFWETRLMSDNHWSYARSLVLAELLDQRGIKHVFIRPHCPWQNGKVERFNRNLQTKWAYRQTFRSNQECADALAPWLYHYNNERNHTALGGHTPSVDCHQPDGRVRLELLVPASSDRSRSALFGLVLSS